MLDAIVVSKPQPTIRGYNAWVLDRLVRAKGTTLAEITAWVVDRWIDENRAFLASEFDITRDQFQRPRKLVPYPNKKA